MSYLVKCSVDVNLKHAKASKKKKKNPSCDQSLPQGIECSAETPRWHGMLQFKVSIFTEARRHYGNVSKVPLSNGQGRSHFFYLFKPLLHLTSERSIVKSRADLYPRGWLVGKHITANSGQK